MVVFYASTWFLQLVTDHALCLHAVAAAYSFVRFQVLVSFGAFLVTGLHALPPSQRTRLVSGAGVVLARIGRLPTLALLR